MRENFIKSIAPFLEESQTLPFNKDIYPKPDEVQDIWSPLIGSPYKDNFRNCGDVSIEQVPDWYQPYLNQDGKAFIGKTASELIYTDLQNTALIVDIEGSTSITLATYFAYRGFQPIVLLDYNPNDRGNTFATQSYVKMMYFTRTLENAKKQKLFTASSLPIFALDSERNRSHLPNSIDTSYQHEVNDFPSSQELVSQGITNIIYIQKQYFDYHSLKLGKVEPARAVREDIQPILSNWNEAGLNTINLPIYVPRPQDNPWQNLLLPE